jgi:DNA-binding GntR family transcriptional regulator
VETNKVFKALRQKIVDLDLLPESVLNLSQLADKFNVSRTPIKEALIFLQAEGLVIRHGSHFMVTPLSLDRIREITEIRSVLEVQAHIWAMNRITKSELTALENIHKDIIAVKNEADNRAIVELDYRFHRLMYRAAKNSQLAQYLENLLSHYTRFWLYIPREMQPKPFFNATIKIIQAVKNRDEAELRMATIVHIRESVEEISSYVCV